MSFTSPGAVGAETPTQGIGVEFDRCGCYYVWITFFGGAEMHRNPSPYYERVNRTFRGKVATCFHCRLTIGLTLEEEDPSLVFIEHYDVERYGPLKGTITLAFQRLTKLERSHVVETHRM